ncbi:MAG: hypothetical protein ACRDTD_02410, partial [Pseudonocardiaceae bacterium]
MPGRRHGRHALRSYRAILVAGGIEQRITTTVDASHVARLAVVCHPDDQRLGGTGTGPGGGTGTGPGGGGTGIGSGGGTGCGSGSGGTGWSTA